MLPISGNDILQLIPQKPPFVMISRLLEANEMMCVTDFTIPADNVLCDNGQLNPSGLLENIAQTAAILSGYKLRIENKEARTGFIGEIRYFKYVKLPVIGNKIITEVTIENKLFDVFIISGKIKLADQEIASCQMKIFEMAEK